MDPLPPNMHPFPLFDSFPGGGEEEVYQLIDLRALPQVKSISIANFTIRPVCIMHCDDFCEIFLPLSMPFNLPTLRSGWRPNFSSPSLPQVVSSICQNEGLYYPPSDPKREVTVQKVAPEEGGPKRRERLIAEE